MESRILTLPPVTEKTAGTRLDSFIASESELSRSGAVRLAEQGNVKVSGYAQKNKNYRVSVGDTVEIELPPAVPDEAQPEDIELDMDDGINLSPASLNALRRAAASALESPVRTLPERNVPEIPQNLTRLRANVLKTALLYAFPCRR